MWMRAGQVDLANLAMTLSFARTMLLYEIMLKKENMDTTVLAPYCTIHYAIHASNSML